MSLTKEELELMTIEACDQSYEKMQAQLEIYEMWMDYVQPYLCRAANNGCYWAKVPSWKLPQDGFFTSLNIPASDWTVFEAVAYGLAKCDLTVMINSDEVPADTMNSVVFSWKD